MSRRMIVHWGGARVESTVAVRAGTVAVTRDGVAAEALYHRDGAWITLTIGGATCRAAVAKDARGLWVACRGRTWLLVPEGREGMARGAADAPDEIRAPMTGRVVAVVARAGSKAQEGDLLLTIEAMKMEFKLTAPEDGTVLEVACAEGDRVELGQLLVRLKPAAGEGAAS
ncbi:MAG TPA: biotin/lipoyl-containing protein [Candidatus Eisenbacteria bacterium]|nr:biotin/lipoyl-containing protein [Candidatus Eisenbacteria bacterium]